MQELARCRERVAELERSERHLYRTQKELREREERCRRMVNRLSTFTRALLAVASAPHLPTGFQQLSDEVKSLLPHDRASFAVADPSGQTLAVYATAGLAGTLDAGIVIPAAGSNVGQVLKGGVPLAKHDIEREADFLEKPRLLDMGIRSNVTVPLWQRDKCVGSLNFGSRNIGTYGPSEVILVQELANHVAVPIIIAQHLREILNLRTATRLIGRPDIRAVQGLTEWELEVLKQLASGAGNKEIAHRLSLSVNTVKFHIQGIYRKLGVHSRAQTVRVAISYGLLVG